MKNLLYALGILLLSTSVSSAQSMAGCTNSGALNYNVSATQDDGTCTYAQEQIPDDFYSMNSCSRVFNEYIKPGDENAEVTLWQKFMNFGFNEQIPEIGYFGEQTKTGVIRFQEFFGGAVLAPWGLTEGTGNVYQTTRSWANRLTGCAEDSFVIEGNNVNHASFAVPRGYEFLRTFNTPNATGYTTLSNPTSLLTSGSVVPTYMPSTYIPPVAPPVQLDAPVEVSSSTGDAEIDLLIQAIMDVESKIESLN